MQIQKIDKIQIVQNKTQMQKEVDNNEKTSLPNLDIVSKCASEAIKNSVMPRIKLHKNITMVQFGHSYKIDGKYKIIEKIPTELANDEWKNRGYMDCPYKKGQHANIIELTKDTVFVRVYDKENSGMKGSWVMNLNDIKNKTPEQIANEFSLPKIPKYICDVKLPKGTRLRTGECNPLYGHDGGGIQYDLMGKRVGEFSNERLIQQI
ncbi:MAG: hypothetical protein ACI37S_06080 [Candidatus Gastranaerophilaceae bacterium]